LIFKLKPHTLNDQQEKLLSKVSIINGGFENIFGTLTGSEIKFADAVDSKNRKVKLETFADVMLCLKSKDRVLRKSS